MVRAIILLLAVAAPLGAQFGAGSAFGRSQQAIGVADSAKPNDANALKPTTRAPTEGTEAVGKLTLEDLQARKKTAMEASDLAEDMKVKLAEVYDKAIAQLQLVDELTGKKDQYHQTAKAAPAELTELQDSLTQPATSMSPKVAPDLTLAQAEQALTQATLDLEEAKKRAAGLEGEPKRRADRRTKIPEESNAAGQQMDEIKRRLAATPTVEQPSLLADANRILLQLQQQAQQARMEANREELLFYDATNDLLAAQRDAATRQVATQEKLLAFWQEKVSTLRQQAAQAAKEEAVQAQKETRSAHPAIQGIARENARLAELRAELVDEIQEIGTYSEAISAKLATERKELEELSQQVETAGGVTDAMGMLLLGKRDKLP
ncbi:MAG: hypothetical protein ACYTAS_09765, partial [Planctomycetota bacterium]